MQFPLNSLGFIWGLRPFEIFLIVLVALLLFGTKKLPDLAKGFGKAIREFKKSASGVEKGIKEAMESEDAPVPAPAAPTEAPVAQVATEERTEPLA